jgi:hypothetical protein
MLTSYDIPYSSHSYAGLFMTSSTSETQLSLEQFNPASRALQATDIFYVFQSQYGEVALPASYILQFVQKYIGAGLFITNGAPDNETGSNGDYALDLSTGNIFGPMTDNAWPGTTGTMIAGALTAALSTSLTNQMTAVAQANRAQLLLGNGAPNNSFGIQGQSYLDTENGVIYGPYMEGEWPAGIDIVASGLTTALTGGLTTEIVSAMQTILAEATGAAGIGYLTTTVAAQLGTFTSQIQALQNATILKGTSAALGGSALSAGASTSSTVSVPGATAGMAAIATPTTYPGDAFRWAAYVSTAGVVTVTVVAESAGTPTSSVYNVRVIP